jgi:hypothetical protein
MRNVTINALFIDRTQLVVVDRHVLEGDVNNVTVVYDTFEVGGVNAAIVNSHADSRIAQSSYGVFE